MFVGTVTSKGQTTIPKAVRDELGLCEGSRIEWQLEGGKASIAVRRNRAVDLAGILGAAAGALANIEEMNEAVGRALADDDERISREWHVGLK